MNWMIWTDAPWDKTAYGRQCRDLIRAFREDGHEVAVLAKHGLSGATIKWGGTTIYAPFGSDAGVSALGTACRHFNADVVLSLYEVWAFPPDVKQHIPVPWIAYYPIDGSPVPEEAIKRLHSADWITAYTEWGLEEMQNAGLEAYYTPPGFDVDMFSPGDKAAARKELNLPDDRFVITSVGANKGYPCRKSWEEVVLSFAIFQRKHEDALLYAHTTKTPRGANNGMNFADYAAMLGIPRGSIAYPDQEQLYLGVPDEQMAKIYQASDVLLFPSRAEGFGFPAVEAQLCGIPVVTINAHALGELTINGRKVMRTTPQWIPPVKYFWQIPDVAEIVAALENTYIERDTEQARKMSELGRAHHVAHYSHEAVWRDHWRPFIEKVEAALW